MGKTLFGVYQLITHYVIGWVAYLFTGVTGGHAYGRTNHFWPWNDGEQEMFPGKWKNRVFISDIGILAMLCVLAFWAKSTSICKVFLMYGLPYAVINFFLVFYNLLTHTDVDLPYFDKENWEYVKGSF